MLQKLINWLFKKYSAKVYIGIKPTGTDGHAYTVTLDERKFEFPFKCMSNSTQCNYAHTAYRHAIERAQLLALTSIRPSIIVISEEVLKINP